MLTLIRVLDRRTKNRLRYGLFQCDCGKTKEITLVSVKNGHTRSCGCLKKRLWHERRTRHGMARTRFYKIWKNMISRTTNKNTPRFRDYGGRGIGVCSEWRDFKNFYKDMKDGYKDTLSIDRIDNNAGYSKENCRWTAQKDQCRNTRKSIILTYNGRTASLAEWSEITGMKGATLRSRLKVLGWSVERTLATPIKEKESKLPNDCSLLN